jgi:Na+/glutamate symporter
MLIRLLQRPAIFAAVVAAAATVGIAVAGAIGGAISAYFQHKTDLAKFETETLLTLLKLNAGEREEYTSRLIQAGKLRDPDGAVCMAFVGKSCPIKVMKTSQ